MSLNQTPSGERLHIGIFGRRNAGKSSVINALTGQKLAIVSDVLGTTTDPVLKAMELLPLGPVVMIDTPGLDDEGALGELRVQKAYQMLNKSDIALLVVDALAGMTEADQKILTKIKEKEIPFLLVWNKMDLVNETLRKEREEALSTNLQVWVSAEKKEGIFELKERIGQILPQEEKPKRIVGDLIQAEDLVVLVTPIDSAAPKGRLILPQQMTIRDILDSDATAAVVKETGLEKTLTSLAKVPSLVITDSQAFSEVAAVVPGEIPLTSFSILMARYKGDLRALVGGAKFIENLEDGDTVLISEGCTHHRQCGDIGTVKLPAWLKKYTGKNLNLEFTSGTEFPYDLSKYKLIIHCGGCTLNEREMKFRMKCAKDAKVPMTNYGTAIAYMKGILGRSTAIFENEL